MKNICICVQLGAVLLIGCKPGLPEGGERGSCFPNKTCNSGLTCLSGVCVTVPEDFCSKGQAVGPAPSVGKMVSRLDNYKRQALAVEAQASLKKIQAGARQFFVSDHYNSSGELEPRRFPNGSSSWTPANTCCQQSDGRCLSMKEDWGSGPWRTLRFGLYEPHRYQYRFTSQGQDQSSSFTAEARGDLDCNGKYSSYQVTGTVDSEFNVVIRGPVVVDALE